MRNSGLNNLFARETNVSALYEIALCIKIKSNHSIFLKAGRFAV